MFCKWCGYKLVSSDTKCKRCGKELPALSDCGGFYDLVTITSNNNEIQQVFEVPTEKLPSRKESRFGMIALAIAYLLAILVFLTIIVLGNQ